MASTSSTQRINLAGSNRPRRPMHPARKRLFAAALLVMIGSWLPWVYVGGEPFAGHLGPGLWSFYAGVLGLAAVLMPWRRISGGHAAVMAAACLALPAWQLGHLVSLVGFAGWMPGPAAPSSRFLSASTPSP
jgi:hypothetical protein